MDDEHILALVEAVHGADLDAIHVFAFDTGFVDDVSHCSSGPARMPVLAHALMACKGRAAVSLTGVRFSSLRVYRPRRRLFHSIPRTAAAPPRSSRADRRSR